MKDIEKVYLKYGDGKGNLSCCLESTSCSRYHTCAAAEWEKLKKIYPLNMKYKETKTNQNVREL